MKISKAVVAVLVGGAAYGQTPAALDADDCFATLDLETGEQTDPNCPAPNSDEASPTAVIASLHKLDSTCPPPTVADKSGTCILTGDLCGTNALDTTLDLDSFTTLNCRGHKICAKTPVVRTAPTSAGYTPSGPEVGIVIHRAYGIKIMNCVLTGPDFGIVIVDAKLPPGIDDGTKAQLRNKLLSNSITATIAGVLVVHSDNVQISGNTIAYSSGAGLGISLVRDSDANLVSGNSITGPANLSTYVQEFERRIPGDNGRIGTCPNCGAITYDPPAIPLFNFRLGTLFIQFPNQPDSRLEDNVFDSNNVVQSGSSVNTNHFGIALAVRSIRPVATGNFVTGGFTGIQGVGFPPQTMGVFPGTCSTDASLFCARDADCPGGAAGSCSRTCTKAPDVSCSSTVPCPTGDGACMPGSIRIIDGRVYDALIANNTLNGPFDSAGIGLANQVRPVAQGNVVTGAAGEPGAGFFLTADALGTSCAPPAPGVACSDPATLVGATLTHNVVRGMKFGLQLDSSGASGFAALVSINDFVASTLFGVKLSASYPTTSAFHADLSELGEGNYWGHSCGADGTGGFTSSDSSNVNVAVDSHPFGISTTTSPLPPTCR